MVVVAAVGFLVVVMWLHTLAAALCLWPSFDRWARRQALGRRRVRSFLPFWGLFAQAGMFDLDICHRVVHPAGDATPWCRLTRNERSWWSWLWRPGSRDDHCATVLARQLLAATGDPRALPAYGRITRRVREAARREGEGDRQWCLQVSRGFWSTAAPEIVLVSPPPRLTGERPAE
jgi:hypothetical protein